MGRQRSSLGEEHNLGILWEERCGACTSRPRVGDTQNTNAPHERSVHSYIRLCIEQNSSVANTKHRPFSLMFLPAHRAFLVSPSNARPLSAIAKTTTTTTSEPKGDLSPGSGPTVMSSGRRPRGRSRSITDSDAPNGAKKVVRSSSAGKAAILRVAKKEEAAAKEKKEAAALAAAAKAAAEALAAQDDGEEMNWHRSASNAAMEALDGERGRGLSDAIREEVQRSIGAAQPATVDEEEGDGSLEEEERRRLREKAFAIVVYASGDRCVLEGRGSSRSARRQCRLVLAESFA